MFMINRSRHILAPPIFDDEEKTHAARLLNFILLSAIGITSALVIITLLSEPNPRIVVTYGIPIVLQLGALLLMRRGHVRLTSLLFTALAWLYLQVFAFYSGGVNSNTFTTHFTVILMAGLLLGGRAALVYVALSVLTGLGLLYAESLDALPLSILSVMPTTRWITNSANLAVAAILLHLETRTIRESLASARGEIVERKRTDKALHRSEERLSLALNAGNVGLWDWNIETDQTVWTDNVESLFALPAGSFVGSYEAFLNLIHVDDREEVTRLVNRSLEHGEAYHVEHRIQTSDQSVRWLAQSGEMFSDDTGKPRRMLGTTRDITKRKEAQQALRASEEKWRSLVEDAPEIIFTVDIDGTVEYLNQTVPELTPEMVIGTSIYEYLPPEYHDVARNSIEYVFQTGKSTHYEIRGLEVLDSSWYSIRIGAVKRDGKVVAATNIARNVTKRKQIEKDEREQRKLAEALRDSAAALNSTLKVDEVLDRILVNVERVVPRDCTAILLVESGVARVTRVRYENQQKTDDLALNLQYKISETPNLRRIFETGQPLAIPDTHADPDWLKRPATMWMRSYVGAPISVKGHVIGFLNLISRTAGFFNSTHAERLQTFADQAAIAIENARLYEETDQLRAFNENIVQSMEEGIVVTDASGHITFVNPKAAELLEYTPEDLVGLQQKNIMHPGPGAQSKPEILQDSTSRHESVLTTRSGREISTIISTRALFEKEHFQGMLSVFTDITERKRAEEALAREHNLLQTVLETALDFIYVKDVEGRHLITNPAHMLSLGISSLEDIIGKKNAEIHTPEVAARYDADEKAIIQTGQPLVSKEETRLDSAGKPIWMSTTKVPLRDTEGEIIGIVGITRDITERKRAEEALRDSETKLRAIVQNTSDFIYIKDKQGRYLLMNPAAASRFNLPPEEIPGKTDAELYDLETYYELRKNDLLVMGSGKKITFKKRYFVSGSEVIRIGEKFPYISDQGEVLGVIGISRDITRAVWAEEALHKSEAKLRSIVENAPNLILSTDLAGKILFANRTLEGLDVVGKNIYDFVSTTDYDRVKDCIEGVIQRGEAAGYEIQGFSRQDPLWYAVRVGPIEQDAQIVGITIIYTDITERMLAEERLKAALAEKEVMLKEIHHRVKNNLQLVSSLLDLQAEQIQDERALEALIQSQNRVRSMSFIHEQLYQSKDLSQVDFGEYLYDLASNLLHSYSVSPDRIEMKINVDHILLAIDTAIPCGLLVHELASNSLKHAFPDGSQGEINITLEQTNDDLTLIVADTGIGFPENIDFRDTESLGLQLAVTLVHQLDGSIELDHSTGTRFTVRFPAHIAKPG